MILFVTHIFLALVLGICIGVERQWSQRVIGLRTTTLVSVGAATFMILATKIGGDAEGRIASYIVSGMGFLGAGVIIKDGASIRGLNTAATLWCTAAIGAFCGLGYIYEPLIVTIAILIIHVALRPLSNKLKKQQVIQIEEHEEITYELIVSCKETEENHVRVLLVQYIGNNRNLMLRSLSSSDEIGNPSIAVIHAEILSATKQDEGLEKIASFLTLEKDVTAVKWITETPGE